MSRQLLQRLQLAQFTDFLKNRPRDAHKGLYGHVVVIGGDYGFQGAPHLAAMAALRVGAGRVTLVTRQEHAFIVQPEVMVIGIESSRALTSLLKKATVIALGPGLGQSSWGKKMLTEVLRYKTPTILDADALNLLAKQPRKAHHWILTPHPGEAGRLLQQTTETIQRNRFKAVQMIQKQYQGICVLKGAGTLIYGEDGRPAICQAGNPGMATAGMGDVLTGVISGLLAQGLELAAAAKLGVLVAALAGDLAAKKGGERGMIATDLLPCLRQVVNP